MPADARTYLFDPDGSHHAPRSEGGCLLFVRLRQSPGADRPRIVLDTAAGAWAPGPGPDIEIQLLYAQAGYADRVRLERWGPGAARPRHPAGEELFVLEGTVRDEEGVAGPGYWLRYPPGDAGALHSDAGCRLYVRVGG